MAKKIYYNEITILKVIATFLITWFHFKWTVPKDYAFLFIGGAIGNSLFFYASGYLLKFRDELFKGEWMLNKIIRLYPSVWVFLILTLFLGNNLSISWKSYLYPTPFWFINCILFIYLFIYLFFYLFRKFFCDSHITKGGYILLISVFIIYVLNYLINVDHTKITIDDGSIKSWFYFFFLFFWGYRDSISKKCYKGTWKSVLYFPFFIGLFYLYKTIGAKSEIAVFLQFVIVPLLLSLVVLSARYFVSFLYKINISETKKYILSYISNLTLDIYIVQVFLINKMMPYIIFPLNICFMFLVILISGIIVQYLARYVSIFISNIIKLLSRKNKYAQ